MTLLIFLPSLILVGVGVVNKLERIAKTLERIAVSVEKIEIKRMS